MMLAGTRRTTLSGKMNASRKPCKDNLRVPSVAAAGCGSCGLPIERKNRTRMLGMAEDVPIEVRSPGVLSVGADEVAQPLHPLPPTVVIFI